MRKKWLVSLRGLLCALVLTLALAGCAPTAPAQTAPPENTAPASASAAPEATLPPETAQVPESAPPAQPALTPEAALPQQQTCTISITCAEALGSAALPDAVRAVLPADGRLLSAVTVPLEDGDTVWTVLQRVTRANGVQMEASWTPATGSAYVQGIGNLYERDCGARSGWVYAVNGVSPNVGCSSYALAPGDVVQWSYTCDGRPG